MQYALLSTKCEPVVLFCSIESQRNSLPRVFFLIIRLLLVSLLHHWSEARLLDNSFVVQRVSLWINLLAHSSSCCDFRMFGNATEVQIQWKAFPPVQIRRTARRHHRRPVRVGTKDCLTMSTKSIVRVRWRFAIPTYLPSLSSFKTSNLLILLWILHWHFWI